MTASYFSGRPDGAKGLVVVVIAFWCVIASEDGVRAGDGHSTDKETRYRCVYGVGEYPENAAARRKLNVEEGYRSRELVYVLGVHPLENRNLRVVIRSINRRQVGERGVNEEVKSYRRTLVKYFGPKGEGAIIVKRFPKKEKNLRIVVRSKGQKYVLGRIGQGRKVGGNKAEPGLAGGIESYLRYVIWSSPSTKGGGGELREYNYRRLPAKSAFDTGFLPWRYYSVMGDIDGEVGVVWRARGVHRGPGSRDFVLYEGSFQGEGEFYGRQCWSTTAFWPGSADTEGGSLGNAKMTVVTEFTMRPIKAE